MLANIINGKPSSESKNSKWGKTTLIVASPALIAQWDQEIRKHCFTSRENKKHGIGMVLQHRAGSRIVSNDIESIMREADIVLTTYSEICGSYPKKMFPPNLVTEAQKNAHWQKLFEEEAGVFHKLRFLRVVIDEAAVIKNYKSHTSQACVALQGKHCWAISGTPVMNSLSEFYP